MHSWSEAWEQLQQYSWINASFHDAIDRNNPVWDLAYDRDLDSDRLSVGI